jgi:MFS family permease
MVLASAQALFQTSAVLLGTVGGLAGLALAPSTLMATLPVATIALGTALATIPASIIMGRFGRKVGFVLGAMFGAIGGVLAAAAMVTGSFMLLCVGTALVGAYQGCAQFYRFAAAEASSAEYRSRAISFVLAGGVVAALVGPHLGAVTRNVLRAEYAASFLGVTLLSLAAIVLLLFTKVPDPTGALEEDGAPRSLHEIARQPKFVAAVGGAAIGYAVMVTVMTATPLSMVSHDHSVGNAATVIQWHVLGMFVPSFFTGRLIRKVGISPMMLCGTGLLLAHVLVAISGYDFLHYISALMLLGLGWNFLYVGGSTLLLETYRPSERAKVQAFNDFTIVTIVAIGSFSAGALNELFGWRGLNLFALPLLALAAVLILFGAVRTNSQLREAA